MDNAKPSLAAETQALADAYAALNRSDIPGFTAIFDPQIERIEPADFPQAGTYRGLEAVTAHVVKGRGTWAEGGCEPERFVVAPGERIIVLVHVRVRLKDETEWREGRVADVYTFRNGKAIQFRTFGDERQALEWAVSFSADPQVTPVLEGSPLTPISFTRPAVQRVVCDEHGAGTRYWIDPRDKPGLLRAMMRKLAGDAHISFEGDLSRCTFPASLNPSTDETDALLRQTAWPKQDFVVLPLEPDTVAPILDVVLPHRHRQFLKDIIHIQIERHGELQFGAYDNFHRDCVVCYGGVDPALLDQLKSSGVIRSWQVAPEGEHRWHD